MDDLIPRSLAPGPRRALNAALLADPALADELEMIAPQLDPARRERFWEELAAACTGSAEAEARPGRGRSAAGPTDPFGARPAAAVLAALERAAGPW